MIEFYKKHRIIFLICFYSIIVGIISIYLGQDLNWDLQNYHVYNPYQLLENRFALDVIPAQVQTFFNPILDIPPFIAIYWFNCPPILIGFTLGAVQGLNLFLMHIIALKLLPKKKFTEALVFISTLTAVGGAIFFSEIGTYFGDTTTSIFILFSVYFVINGLINNTFSRNELLYIGLGIGIGTGLKYTNVIYAVGIILTINVLIRKDRLITNFYIFIASSVGFLVCAGYWLIFLWKTFDNPVLPLLNHIFKSEYLEQASFRDARFIPRTIAQFIFYPFYFLRTQSLPWEMPFRDPRMAIGMCSAVFICGYNIYQQYISNLQKFTFNRGALFLAINFIVTYIVWIIINCYYRYLAPQELFSGLLFLVIILTFVTQFYIRLLLTLLSCFLIIQFTIVPSWGRGSWTQDIFAIDSSRLLQYENSTIVLWHTDPTSYIAPDFPSSTRFIRIKSNGMLSKDSLFFMRAKQIIKDTPENKLYVLESSNIPNNNSQMDEDLRNLNLVVDYTKCQSLETKSQLFYICTLSTL